MVVAESAKEGICAEARLAYPNECCGALLGEDGADGRHVGAIMPIVNGSDDGERHRRFRISADEIMRMEREAAKLGLDVLGFYHSHPDHPAVPSEYDREHALPFYSYIIASVRGGEIVDLSSWTLRADRSGFSKEGI